MKITVNGQNKDFPEGSSIKSVIENARPDCSRVIAELNGEILKRDQWAETSLNNGDRLELVSFVGGG